MSGPPASAAASKTPGRARLRIAVALYAELDHDSRVLREAISLVAAGHEVTIYCLSWNGPGETPFRVITKVPGTSKVLPRSGNPFRDKRATSRVKGLLRRAAWIPGYAANLRSWGRWAVEAAGDVDVWHSHDLPGLMAVGPFVPARSRLVYDSHEIFLESGSASRMPWLVRRLLGRYEARLASHAAALVTVNEAYAEVLQRRLHPKQTVIVRNCPPAWDPPTVPDDRLRAAAGLRSWDPVVLYHGAFGAHRGIEQTVAALAEPGMEAVHLVLLGFGDLDRLGIDLTDPRHGGRIHLLPAVAPSELLEWVTGADADVVALQGSTLNHYLCTPNKLWESLACGVPVVVSDFPVMRRIVMDDPSGPLGSLCQADDPASIAAALHVILDRTPDERAALREACLEAAHERWNWETESARLTELYVSLTEQS